MQMVDRCGQWTDADGGQMQMVDRCGQWTDADSGHLQRGRDLSVADYTRAVKHVADFT